MWCTQYINGDCVTLLNNLTFSRVHLVLTMKETMTKMKLCICGIMNGQV